MKTPVIETDRLILKPLELGHAPAIQKYFNNWNIIKNMSTVVPWPYPDDGAETFVRDNALPRVAKGTSHIWVVTLKENPDEAVGVIDYHDDENSASHGNRGNWIAEHLHGQGYMTEAISAVQDFLFFELGVEKMRIVNAVDNKQSSRVQQKTGGTLVGACKLEHHSGHTDTEVWELTRNEWATQRGRDAI